MVRDVHVRESRKGKTLGETLGERLVFFFGGTPSAAESGTATTMLTCRGST